jgi:hypothetical protein
MHHSLSAAGMLLLCVFPPAREVPPSHHEYYPIRPAFTPGHKAEAVPLPVGISDLQSQTGFFANACNGIDVLDLKTGKVLYRIDQAQVPLFVLGSHLFAYTREKHQTHLLAFDLKQQGWCNLVSEPIVLPGWAEAGSSPGHSFSLTWQQQDHSLLLTWKASAHSSRRPRVLEVALPLRKHASGTARVDLLTGKVTPGPGEEEPAPPVRAPKRFEQLAIRWHALLGHKELALVEETVASPPQARRATAPEQTTGFGRPGLWALSRPERVLILRAWDRHTGKVLSSRPLLRGRSPHTCLTLDGQFLCLRDARPSPDLVSGSSKADVGKWSIFTREGEAMGQIPHVPGTEALAVHAGRAYVLVSGSLAEASRFHRLFDRKTARSRGDLSEPVIRPRSVQAFDLKTGIKQWEHEVAGKLTLPPSF